MVTLAVVLAFVVGALLGAVAIRHIHDVAFEPHEHLGRDGAPVP